MDVGFEGRAGLGELGTVLSPARGNKYIFRFQVSVQDALRVHVSQTVGELHEPVHHITLGKIGLLLCGSRVPSLGEEGRKVAVGRKLHQYEKHLGVRPSDLGLH